MDNAKILLVDDDAQMLEVLTFQLQSQYDVTTAISGQKALQLTEDEGPFAVIICDMQMPEMNGVEVLELMQKTSPDTTRVMLTVAADQQTAIDAINTGNVFRFLNKPCTKKDLIRGVDDAMKQHQLATTERRLLEKTKIIAAQKKELEELNQEKDKFFSIIAHDLRAPFGALLGFTTILDMSSENSSRKEIKSHAANIHKSATHVFRLLENLLEWSALQMEGVDYNPSVVDLHEIVEKTRNVLSPVAAGKGIKITENMNCFKVYADQHMLDAVIRNLVNNAIKFTSEGGKITAKAKQGNGLVTVSICDTGVGMDQIILDKLFKLSESITTKGTKGETGTGLGLILCKDLVERNGGRIWAESEVGRGSTFSFTLPISE